MTCSSSSSLQQSQDSHAAFSSSRRPSYCRSLCVYKVLCILTIIFGVVKTQHDTSSRILTIHYFWTKSSLCRCSPYTEAVSGHNHFSLKILQIEYASNLPINSIAAKDSATNIHCFPPRPWEPLYATVP